MVTWALGSLDAGASATVTMDVIPTTLEDLTNTAIVTGNVTELDLQDNALTLLSQVADPQAFVVNTTDDVDDGTADAAHTSLREAIRLANATDGLQRIYFDIPGPGPHTIQPLSPLPKIVDPVHIDATTEPDYAGLRWFNSMAAWRGPPTGW